jgi:hypothetical protein
MALPPAIHPPSIGTFLRSIDPPLPPPFPINQPRITHLLIVAMTMAASSTVPSPKIPCLFQHCHTVRHRSSPPNRYHCCWPYICPSETIIFGHAKSLEPLTILWLLVPLHWLKSNHSTIDKATVIEWLHYPLGYSDGKDYSKITI